MTVFFFYNLKLRNVYSLFSRIVIAFVLNSIHWKGLKLNYYKRKTWELDVYKITYI